MVHLSITVKTLGDHTRAFTTSVVILIVSSPCFYVKMVCPITAVHNQSFYVNELDHTA